MTDDGRFFDLLTDVLDAPPSIAPDRLLRSVLRDVQATPQRGRGRSIERWRDLLPSAGRSRLAPVGLVLGVVAVVALFQLVPRLVTGPAAGAVPTPAAVAKAPAWTATGSMATPRDAHTATLLPDGRVLVAGGLVADTGLAAAELYDPRTGSWTATGSMIQGRAWHTATLLQDGTVLVTGGLSTVSDTPGGADIELASAELYDPRTGSWSTAGSMTEARSGPTATRLPDGRVLVAGGWGSTEPFGPKLASSELFDPATRTWTASGSLPEPFGGHTAILLANGMVLIAGGDVPRGPGAAGSAHAAVYDAAVGTWTATRSMTTARLAQAAALLPDGRVLVSGGGSFGDRQAPTYASVELYDPATRTWTATADMTSARAGHTATTLADGRVLAVGGANDTVSDPLASAELLALAGGS
jgi:N-acetylneuraminic acid mutarotase